MSKTKSKSKEVWVAHITTESSDHYYYCFKQEPSRLVVYDRFIKESGESEDYPEELMNLKITKCIVYG